MEIANAGRTGGVLETTPLDRALDGARRAGRRLLSEAGGFPVLAAAGIATPVVIPVASSEDAARFDLDALPGDRVVVKVASQTLLHRSDVGGVAIVPKRKDLIVGAVRALEYRMNGRPIDGYTINEFVPHSDALGHELLVGLRWTQEFGAVLVVAPGGLAAELMVRHLRPGDAVAMFAVDRFDDEHAAERLGALPWLLPIVSEFRGQRPALPMDVLVGTLRTLATLGRTEVPARLVELEVNPFAVTPRGLVALDVLVRLADDAVPRPVPRTPRPVEKIAALLHPRSVGIVGVSESRNPGRVILENLLREGFSRERLYVVKPGASSVAGVPAAPSIADVPERLDLLVLAIAAAQVPAAIEECLRTEKAESIVVIPGGLDEKSGTGALMAPVYEALERSRRTPWRGPVVNGGNCLGVRSVPGRIDTLFIPTHKLPVRRDDVAPLAVVSQSGAFAIAKMTRLGSLNPRYVVTVGNQMDLTVGDYLAHFAADPSLRVFAVYVEGFRTLDGARLLEAARSIVESGRRVILYRAGRTAAGAKASASHTASMAGDYTTTSELARDAGVLVAETLDEFDDLVTMALAFDGRPIRGTRVGALSNAGFECVAMADSLHALELASFTDETVRALDGVCRDARIATLVDVHNPLDLTPMAADAAYEAAVRAVLADANVEVGVIGCVPPTPALNTLATGGDHAEDVTVETSIARRLSRVWHESTLPWVAVVDGGRLYDPMVAVLEASGIPTFRSADRAVAAIEKFVTAANRTP